MKKSKQTTPTTRDDGAPDYTPCWKAVMSGRRPVRRASTLRALWAACGEDAPKVDRLGLGSTWVIVEAARCPEAWAQAVFEQTDIGYTPAGLVERDDEPAASRTMLLDMAVANKR